MNLVRLGAASSGRNNNLNLIRMLAAFAVLVSHAWPLDLGSGTPEPLKSVFGKSLGTLAVYVFFVISGFLITASFERSGSTLRFAMARALRLLPGLFVSLLLVAFCMGPMVTTLTVTAYLYSAETWQFMLRNMTLLWPQYTLPGVFETNPFPAVEGSIWTLIHEVLCYVMVLVAGLAGLLGCRRRMIFFLAIYAGSWLLTKSGIMAFPERILVLQSLSLPFVLGKTGWIFRDSIILSFWLVIALAMVWVGLSETALAFPALVFLIGYSIAWLAFAPGGIIREYNRLGDYSYGIYIYAFPVQGLVAWFFGSVGPGLHILIATPPVLILSVASWHLIEEPALRLLRRHYVPAPSRHQARAAAPTDV